MAICLFPSCKAEATGGFKHEPKDAKKDWSYTAWCDGHEADLRRNLKGPGRFLTKKELDAIS
jgi:hypothetical protein